MHSILKSRACSPLVTLSAAALLSLAPLAAEADSDRHQHRHGREYKEKYWDGACKVERKWKRNGEYQEKRKCRDDYRQGYGMPQQVLVPMPAPAIVITPPTIIIRP
ncbi:hypothetical protein RAS12_16955 [Achromobacter seleniivolatilans]|uniref:Membrane lipoprotein, cell wall extensin motif n=1 Tax=Achromobacter seleniivolatilans TaxID=3047478 RepID=A0ABY9LWF9_9BURK|nr:hypothetical protein [Achromobacter sp. R39]WMD18328.1 hypothetical protein RAS12_16955 [Achromobacter sp. R39]